MGGYMALFRSEVDGSDACIAMLLSNGQVLFQICAGVENGHNRLQVRDVFVLHGLKRHPGIVPNGTSVAPYPEPDFRAFAVEIFIKGMAGDLKSHAVPGNLPQSSQIGRNLTCSPDEIDLMLSSVYSISNTEQSLIAKFRQGMEI